MYRHRNPEYFLNSLAAPPVCTCTKNVLCTQKGGLRQPVCENKSCDKRKHKFRSRYKTGPPRRNSRMFGVRNLKMKVSLTFAAIRKIKIRIGPVAQEQLSSYLIKHCAVKENEGKHLAPNTFILALHRGYAPASNSGTAKKNAGWTS